MDSECLGNPCRRRTHKAAKVIGELLRSVDPMVSEWGNPARFIPSDLELLFKKGNALN